MDARYWLFHLWLPLLPMVGILYLFEHSALDITLADYWYQMEGGSWALRNHWFTYNIMHHWGKMLIIAMGITLMSLYILSWKLRRLRQWRWSLHFSFIAMILVPVIIASMKRLSGVPCPWSLSEFGGTLAYLHSYQHWISQAAGHCFPAAHASSGFGLLALYFGFSPFMAKKRFWLLLPGLAIGFSFGLAQQLRGAHFISHDLWSLSIAWFVLLLLQTIAWRFIPPTGPSEPMEPDA